MDELGHILREARETKGLTLQEVQSEIRINARYLEAMENGDYDRLPTPVHVRGFLRNYARFLGLDPNPLLDRYDYSLSNRSKNNNIPPLTSKEPIGPALHEPPVNHQFFDPVNMEVESGFSSQRSGNRSESIVRLVVIIGLIGLIYLAGQRFIPMLTGSDNNGSESLTEGITEFLENITSQEEATAVAEPTPDLLPTTFITSTGRNNFAIVTPESGTAITTTTGVNNPAPSSATITRPALPATMEQIILDIFIHERGLLEVTIDGDVVFSGIARPGDSFQWTAENEAKVLSGNAIGVDVTINEIPWGRLGGRGENAEETWTTTN
jgi:cytoskeletal protein RodZ